MNLTSLQKAIVTTNELQPSNSSYNLPYLWHLTGNIDVAKLRSALEKVFNSHDVYHAYIKNNSLVEESNRHFKPIIMDFSQLSSKEFRDQVISQATFLANKPINIKKYPLEQAIIFTNSSNPNECFLFLNISHMICDVYSAYQLFSEISTIYNGGHLVSFSQFFNSNNNVINLNREKRALSYFKNKISGLSSLAQSGLPTSKGPRQEFELKIDQNKTKDIMETTKKSEFEVLLTFYILFLYRLTGQKQIIVGVPIANRRTTNKKTHGCFVNNLPLIITLREDLLFKDVLNQVSKELHNLLRFQSFDFIKHKSQLEKQNLSFVNNSVTLYKNPITFNFNNIDCTNVPIAQESLMFPLAIEFENKAQEIIAHIQLDNDFNKEITSELLDYIVYTSDCNSTIKEIIYKCNKNITSTIFHRENSNYLKEFKDTCGKDTLSLIKSATITAPQNIAVKDLNSSITYAELDKVSTNIANILSKYSNNYIAVSLEPSVLLIEVILGIIKAGKVYVPIDKYMPSKRKKMILDQLPNCPAITDYSNPIFKEHFLITPNDLYSHNLENKNVSNKKATIAYMIFTSGSTGMPKGVKVPLHALNSLTSLISNKLEHNMNWILFHSYGFDYSIFEIFGALTTGGTLNIVPQEIRKFPDTFRKFLLSNHINVLTQTPSAFISLERYDTSISNKINDLKYIFIGGEDVKFHDLSQWFNKYDYSSPKVFNLYGLTEATIISTGHLITKEDVVNKKINNIGKPIGNTEVDVVNKNGDRCLPGFTGELILSGPAIANGYYNNPQKTKLTFNKSLTVFRTGDLVKVLKNFELQYISRIDNQVQVSGHRIELGEIENAMCCLSDCTEAFVTTIDFNTGDRRLVGYYKLKHNNTSISENGFRKYLKTKLPTYMIPSYLIPVNSFPLNSNGKIDKDKLPNPKRNDINQKQSKKDNSTIGKIINIWSTTLDKQVGENDNFFDDGGTSILISDVYYSILSTFNLTEKDLSMLDLFEYVTPKEVAQFIDKIK